MSRVHVSPEFKGGEKQMTWVGLGGEAENVRHYAQFMAAFVRLKINLISAPHLGTKEGGKAERRAPPRHTPLLLLCFSRRRRRQSERWR